MISNNFWTRHFARDPQVIGKTLLVGGHSVTIVGVTAPGFEGMAPGRPIDITLPLSMRIRDEPEFLTDLDSWTSMPLVVRVKPGIDVRQAQAVIETAFREHVSQPGIGFARTPFGPRTARLQPAANGQDRLRNDYQIPLTVLMGMVEAVLLSSPASTSPICSSSGQRDGRVKSPCAWRLVRRTSASCASF